MLFSNDLIERIEELASLYMTVSDIAVIIGVDNNVLREELANGDSPAAKAYLRGKIKSKQELRRQEIQLAKVGSPLALQNCRDALIEMEEDE